MEKTLTVSVPARDETTAAARLASATSAHARAESTPGRRTNGGEGVAWEIPQLDKCLIQAPWEPPTRTHLDEAERHSRWPEGKGGEEEEEDF